MKQDVEIFFGVVDCRNTVCSSSFVSVDKEKWMKHLQWKLSRVKTVDLSKEIHIYVCLRLVRCSKHKLSRSTFHCNKHKLTYNQTSESKHYPLGISAVEFEWSTSNVHVLGLLIAVNGLLLFLFFYCQGEMNDNRIWRKRRNHHFNCCWLCSSNGFL